MILIELDFCDWNILFLIIERRHKKNSFLLFQVISGCIVWEMIVLDKLAMLDVRTVFPYIDIFLECIFTVELLLESFFLLASSIIHYMKGEIIKLHPSCSVFLVDFLIHLWNDMNLIFPNSSFLQVNVEFRNFIVVIATKPFNCITKLLSIHRIRAIC